MANCIQKDGTCCRTFLDNMVMYDLLHFDRLTNNKLQNFDNMRNIVLSLSQQFFSVSKRAFRNLIKNTD